MSTKRIPENYAERRVWIKGRLELRRISLAQIGRELGVSRQAVTAALWRSYPKMEAAIAAKLGMTPSEIWPERYARRDNSRKRRQKPRPQVVGERSR